MIGAVGGDRAEHFADGLEAAFPRRFQAFDDEGRGAHPDDQAVTAAVERGCRLFDDLVGGGGAGGQEAGAEPAHQVLRGDVVGRDHDHAAAAAGLNPVAGDRRRPGCRWRRLRWWRCSGRARRCTRRTGSAPSTGRGTESAGRNGTGSSRFRRAVRRCADRSSWTEAVVLATLLDERGAQVGQFFDALAPDAVPRIRR